MEAEVNRLLDEGQVQEALRRLRNEEDWKVGISKPKLDALMVKALMADGDRHWKEAAAIPAENWAGGAPTQLLEARGEYTEALGFETTPEIKLTLQKRIEVLSQGSVVVRKKLPDGTLQPYAGTFFLEENGMMSIKRSPAEKIKPGEYGARDTGGDPATRFEVDFDIIAGLQVQIDLHDDRAVVTYVVHPMP